MGSLPSTSEPTVSVLPNLILRNFRFDAQKFIFEMVILANSDFTLSYSREESVNLTGGRLSTTPGTTVDLGGSGPISPDERLRTLRIVVLFSQCLILQSVQIVLLLVNVMTICIERVSNPM